MEWALNIIKNEGILDFDLANYYNLWKTYAIPFHQDSEGIKIVTLPSSYEQLLFDVCDALNYYLSLNEVFNDGKTSIIAVKSFHHANLLSPEIKRLWRICQHEKEFQEFLPCCGAYLLIRNSSAFFPNIIVIANENVIEYWAADWYKLNESEIIKYKNMLKIDIETEINTYKEKHMSVA